tara:strand:- start:623 stop:730 length:108 start_codon:yes stop_codon:yes gene_type:complete
MKKPALGEGILEDVWKTRFGIILNLCPATEDSMQK